MQAIRNLTGEQEDRRSGANPAVSKHVTVSIDLGLLLTSSSPDLL
jgi:hypothetical protein